MKKFLSILFVFSLMISAVTAQVRTRSVSENGAATYGKAITTTDSAFHNIDSIVLAPNEAGIVQVFVVGNGYDTAYSVRGAYTATYNNRRGTLTLDTPTALTPSVTDAALTTSTFSLVAGTNKIYVRIKGRLNYNVRWQSITKHIAVIAY